jgi:23S rRNA pseudouridine2605 synthase
LIEAGRVELDGTIVTQLGTTVDPATSKVRVDGVPLKPAKLIYYAVHKPVGVVTTHADPQGRPRVIDLVPPDDRVFAVGRLDRSSEGLILLTNDGDLAQKLTHPKFGVRKVYRVTVAGRVDPETMKRMRQGIYIAEGHVRVEGARIFKSRSKATEMEIVLKEGKNREIRRILARLGHKVLQLRRIAVGPLRLGELPVGAYRVVTREEVRKLQQATERDDSDRTDRGRKRAGRRSDTRNTGVKKKGAARKTVQPKIARGESAAEEFPKSKKKPKSKATKRTARKATGKSANKASAGKRSGKGKVAKRSTGPASGRARGSRASGTPRSKSGSSSGKRSGKGIKHDSRSSSANRKKSRVVRKRKR